MLVSNQSFLPLLRQNSQMQKPAFKSKQEVATDGLTSFLKKIIGNADESDSFVSKTDPIKKDDKITEKAREDARKGKLPPDAVEVEF